MELHLTGELEAKLTDFAAKRGRNPDELVRDVLTRYLEGEARFIEAVKHGEDALERGEYLTHEQVGERLMSERGSNSGSGSAPKVPILHLGAMGPLHRRDIYDDVD